MPPSDNSPSVILATLFLSIMTGYYAGYLPHHSVLKGILIGMACMVAGVATFVALGFLLWGIVTAISRVLRWRKRQRRSR